MRKISVDLTCLTAYNGNKKGKIMRYAVRVAGEYFCDGPMDNLRVVVMKREQAENLAKILLASGDEQDIEVVEYD